MKYQVGIRALTQEEQHNFVTTYKFYVRAWPLDSNDQPIKRLKEIDFAYSPRSAKRKARKLIRQLRKAEQGATTYIKEYK